MELIDTHAHLYLDQFNNDLDSVVKQAKNNHITKVLLPNIDSGTGEAMHNICNKYPDFFIPMMGLHPCSVKENFQDELSIVKHRLENHNYTAIGESGLDFFHDIRFKEEQEVSLIEHLKLSELKKLPLVLHARNSIERVYEVVFQNKAENQEGVFHCFNGSAELGRKIIDMGYYLGIGGVITFKKSDDIREMLKSMPLERIVLETDAPYLAPVPFRGKRNEPAYIQYIAEVIAAVKGIRLEEVAEITTENAIKLFQLSR